MGGENWILSEILAQRTEVLELQLYEIVGILAGSLIAGGALVLLCVLRSVKRRERVKHASGLILVSVADIAEGFVGGEDGEHRVGAVVLFRGGGGGHRGLQPGEGDRGGILPDLSVVTVKNLLDNKGQAEEFKVEVEAIGKVRYKNLVGLIGYYAEGARRILVYEYIDNGTLEHWLHRVVGSSCPLTWDIRMEISIGTSKGVLLPDGSEEADTHLSMNQARSIRVLSDLCH